MGSPSDHEIMKGARELLKEFGILTEYRAASAHKSPQAVVEFCQGAKSRGLKVIIAAAGGAAHLAGVCAAFTTLPIIAVPIPSGDIGGLDAILSMVQMPGGIPVGTMSTGKWGAKNAALYAVEILALMDQKLSEKIDQFRAKQAKDILEAKLD